MPDEPRVFISYARQDGEQFANALRERLEREEPEITLWQDRARMEGGVGWWKQITEALDVVQFLVLVDRHRDFDRLKEEGVMQHVPMF